MKCTLLHSCDMVLHKFLPHIWHPVYHSNPGLLNLAWWMFSVRSCESIKSKNQWSIWQHFLFMLQPKSITLTGYCSCWGQNLRIFHKINHLVEYLVRLSTPGRRLTPSWWRHQMETFSALLAICAGNSPVPGEFPAQRPMTRGFDVFFDLRPNKRLSKQSRGWWFETPSRSLWRHCND